MDIEAIAPPAAAVVARPARRVYRYRLPVRVMHWINVVCMTVTLSVTPLGDSVIDQETSSIPFGYSADFLLTPIPEPTGLATFAGCALVLARRRRR